MSKKANIIWTLICVIIFFIVFIKIQELFTVKYDPIFQAVKGFYEEPVNTLDAVFIGASNVHAFWQPAIGWADHGISVFSFCINSLRIQAFQYMLDQAHKRQPQALLIINLNCFKDTKVSDTAIHWITNYLPFSFGKLQLINKLAKTAGYEGLDQLEFYFPIIRFHPAWSELDSWYFTKKTDGLKKSIAGSTFLQKYEGQTEQFYETEDEAELSTEQNQILQELLDFCDEKHLNVLFVSVPQAIGKNNKFIKQLNTIRRIVSERNYPCLSLEKAVDEMGIQPKTDFYNNNHTNIHGSIKITEYMAEYLVSQYGFTDKRGMSGWESWDKAAESYMNIISSYTLPFERKHAPRDYDLPAPILNKIVVDNQTLTLTWKASKGADGYDIYRKSVLKNDTGWKYLSSSNADTLEYIDSGLQSETNYTYTVVPKKTVDGIELYGNFNFTGITGTTK